jgi:hypothetical protein
MKRALAATLLLATVTAHAEAPPATAGVAANRMSPALGPGAFAGIESAETTPAGALSWAAGVGLVHDPITLSRAYAGGLVTRPVRDQLVADVAFEFGLWKRLAVGLGAPVVLYQDGDRLRGLGVDETPLATTVAGDVRLRVKATLAGDGTRPGLHAALLVQVTVPGGGQHHFAASDGATVQPRLVLDWRNQRLALAITAGARFAGEHRLFTTELGDELLWGAAGSYVFWARPRATLAALVEGEGAVGVSVGTRPAELRGALRVAVRGVTVDAGGGGGLDGDLGAPAWRLFVVARSGLPLVP